VDRNHSSRRKPLAGEFNRRINLPPGRVGCRAFHGRRVGSPDPPAPGCPGQVHGWTSGEPATANRIPAANAAALRRWIKAGHWPLRAEARPIRQPKGCGGDAVGVGAPGNAAVQAFGAGCSSLGARPRPTKRRGCSMRSIAATSSDDMVTVTRSAGRRWTRHGREKGMQASMIPYSTFQLAQPLSGADSSNRDGAGAQPQA